MNNLSFSDGDPFDEFNSNSEWNPSNVPIILEIWFIIAEIIKLLTCTAALGASIFLVYIISKYEKLRTKSNIFILHYAIACIVDSLIAPVIMLVNSLIGGGMRRVIICILMQITIATFLMVFVFGTAIGVYWFIQNFKKEWIQKINNFQIYFSVMVYAFCVIKLLVYSLECFISNNWFSNYIVFATYCLMLIMVICILIFSSSRQLSQVQLKTKYQLIMSVYIILSYLPLFFYHVLFETLNLYVVSGSFLNYFLNCTYPFADFIQRSAPVITVYLLGRMNKYFRTVYSKVFKKSVRNYQDGDLEDDTENDEIPEDNPVGEDV